MAGEVELAVKGAEMKLERVVEHKHQQMACEADKDGDDDPWAKFPIQQKLGALVRTLS